MSRIRLLVVSLLAAFVTMVPAAAAEDYFLRIKNIQGESTDGKFPKTVDVLSFQWGGTRQPDTGGTGAAAKPKLSELTISKRLDVSSPFLFRALVAGLHIESMELIGRTSGANPVVFMRYCYQDVQVTSQQTSGSGGDDSPTENVSFYFGRFIEHYARQNSSGGIAQNVFMGWNVVQGTLITTYPTGCGT